MMASAQVVETSVNTNNSPSQDYTTNPDDHSNYNIDSPGFKTFTVIDEIMPPPSPQYPDTSLQSSKTTSKKVLIYDIYMDFFAYSVYTRFEIYQFTFLHCFLSFASQFGIKEAIDCKTGSSFLLQKSDNLAF